MMNNDQGFQEYSKGWGQTMMWHIDPWAGKGAGSGGMYSVCSKLALLLESHDLKKNRKEKKNLNEECD